VCIHKELLAVLGLRFDLGEEHEPLLGVHVWRVELNQVGPIVAHHVCAVSVLPQVNQCLYTQKNYNKK
jgi:hypothetical protein